MYLGFVVLVLVLLRRKKEEEEEGGELKGKQKRGKKNFFFSLSLDQQSALALLFCSLSCHVSWFCSSGLSFVKKEEGRGRRGIKGKTKKGEKNFFFSLSLDQQSALALLFCSLSCHVSWFCSSGLCFVTEY